MLRQRECFLNDTGVNSAIKNVFYEMRMLITIKDLRM